MIIGWVFVALLTGINIFVFLKLKKATMQMMNMAFPGAKNMNEALSHMQKLMGMTRRGQGNPFASTREMNPQLKAAMQLLQKKSK